MTDGLTITKDNIGEIMENAKRIMKENENYDPMGGLTWEQMVELFRNPPRLGKN